MNKDRRKRVAAALTALSDIQSSLDNVKSEVEALRDEEAEAFESLPESLRQGEKEEQNTAVSEAFDQLESAFDSLGEAVASLEAVT